MQPRSSPLLDLVGEMMRYGTCILFVHRREVATERERERETDRHRQTHGHRDRDRDREKKREREGDSHRQTEQRQNRDRETESKRNTGTEKKTESTCYILAGMSASSS